MHRAKKKALKSYLFFGNVWSWWLWWQELRSWGSYRSRAAASCGSSKRHNITCNGWHWSDLFCTEASGYPWFLHRFTCWSLFWNGCWYGWPVDKWYLCRSGGKRRSRCGLDSNWSWRSNNRCICVGDESTPVTRICSLHYSLNFELIWTIPITC